MSESISIGDGRRLRAMAVDSAARALAGPYMAQHTTDTQAAGIIALADQLYRYTLTGECLANEPLETGTHDTCRPEDCGEALVASIRSGAVGHVLSGPDELRHGYSFQALLTQAKQSGVNRIPLSETWDTKLILAGFIASGYPDAVLKRPLGRTGIFIHPGEYDPVPARD